MPIDLSRPAREVTTDAASPYRPVFDRLQGNILKKHGRNTEYHVFLRFTGPAVQVRSWLRDRLAARLLSASDQFDQTARRHVQPGQDGGAVTLCFLSAEGYRYLGFDPRTLESKIFRRGMKNEEDDAIDDLLSKGNKDPKPARWEAGYQQVIHAMVQLGDDDETRLLNSLSLLRTELVGLADILVAEEGRALRRTVRDGQTLKTPEPIEHFGYFDGISQPLFTAADLDDYYEKGQGTRPDAEWNPAASLDLVLVPDPFGGDASCFGSFLVYRKLHQDVGKWEEQVSELAAAVGLGGDLAGAMAVGRFKDGTPVAEFSQPRQKYRNDFMFKPLDPDGLRCPAHAHIRKVNPRGTTPHTSLAAEKKRRIARRAIPYGRPMPNISDAQHTDSDPHADRGLLFMCFQANIARQFAFIQRTWCDNPNFPGNVLNLPTGSDTGDDPLIGQDRQESQRWPRKWGDETRGKQRFNFDAAITLKGGEYLFAPSLPFFQRL